MKETEYHAHPAISKSKLDAIARSPLHYWSRYLAPERIEPEPTPAMLFGTAVHVAVLEPERFEQEYTQAPTVSRTTKAGKDAWAEAAAGGKILLKQDEWQAVEGIRRSIEDHPAASAVLHSDGQAELSLFSVDPTTGLETKCRIDYLTKSGWLVDLKTTQDASIAGFRRSIANFRYHVQAGHYSTVAENAIGCRMSGFLFVAVEKTPPYAIQVFKCSAHLVSSGQVEAAVNLQTLKHALDHYPTDTPWPSYSQTLQEISLPSWMEGPSLPNLQTY